MSRKLGTILTVLAIVAGLGLIAYPYVSNYLAQREQAEVISKEFAIEQDMTESSMEDEYRKAHAYNESILNIASDVYDPFGGESFNGRKSDYEAALNLQHNGFMCSIYIPKFGVSIPVYHGTDDEVLQKGAGHLSDTSLPIGCETEHAVIAGHTGLPSVKVFDSIDRLEIDDYFVIDVLGEQLAYRVYDVETVLPEQTESLAVQQGRDLVTLVTCTPYGVNSHRLLVHGERCDMPEEVEEEAHGLSLITSFNSMNDSERIAMLVALLAVMLLLIALTRKVRKRQRKTNSLTGKRELYAQKHTVQTQESQNGMRLKDPERRR